MLSPALALHVSSLRDQPVRATGSTLACPGWDTVTVLSTRVGWQLIFLPPELAGAKDYSAQHVADRCPYTVCTSWFCVSS